MKKYLKYHSGHRGYEGVIYMQANWDEDWGWLIMPCCWICGGPLSDSECMIRIYD